MNKKNQHYVPRFHLRKWSYDGKLISLYNKLNDKFVDAKAPIKNIASKDYMYGKTDVIENKLEKIESKIAPLYEKVIASGTIEDLTPEENILLYLHIILGNERTLATAERYEEFIKSMLYEVLQTGQAHGQYLDIDLKTLKDDIKIKYTYNISIKAALQFFPLIFDLKLTLIKNTSDVEFITSDYPTIKYNLWSLKRKLFSGWGLCSAGILFICPISTDYALMAYDDVIYKATDEKHDKIVLRKNSQIDEINKLMILNAQSCLYFSKNVKPHYIKKLMKTLVEFNEKGSVVQTFGTTDNKLLVFSGKKIFYEANLRFLKIDDGALRMPVPMHAQGLLRPASEELAKEIKAKNKIEGI